MPVCFVCGARRRWLTAFILWPRHGGECSAWYCTRCWATALPTEYDTDEYTQLIRRQCRKCDAWVEEYHTLRNEQF